MIRSARQPQEFWSAQVCAARRACWCFAECRHQAGLVKAAPSRWRQVPVVRPCHPAAFFDQRIALGVVGCPAAAARSRQLHALSLPAPRCFSRAGAAPGAVSPLRAGRPAACAARRAVATSFKAAPSVGSAAEARAFPQRRRLRPDQLWATFGLKTPEQLPDRCWTIW